jgi:maltooligosyltrehalose trehalohydrolase
MADPSDRATFERCQLDPSERSADNPTYRLHRDLLKMRREHPFNAQQHRGVEGAVLSSDAFVLRFLTEGPSDRLLIVNLGRDLTMVPAPEPLLGPPEGYEWIIYWSTENPDYRGGGISPLAEDDGGWQIPGHAAIVLGPSAIAKT